MKLIESYEKSMILQAVNFWAHDLNKGVREIAEIEYKCERVPPFLARLLRENADRVNKLYEKLEQLFEKKYRDFGRCYK